MVLVPKVFRQTLPILYVINTSGTEVNVSHGSLESGQKRE